MVKNNLFDIAKNINFADTKWVVSSVGLEHYLDRVGVTGSIPVQPTFSSKNVSRLYSFFPKFQQNLYRIFCRRMQLTYLV